MRRLELLPGRFAIARLAATDAIPAWAGGTFVSITRTPAELSVVCDEAAVPVDVLAERGWRAMRVIGPIPFEVTGVAAALTAPLAAAGISVFLLATFDTDYLLVKDAVCDRACAALRDTGWQFE